MNQKPNIDPAAEGNLGGGLRGALAAWLRGEVDDMLPARVVSYDDGANRAVLQPLVMVGTTGEEKISRARVPNVPVYRFGGGGFFMRFPIKPGDFGWLKANDRDISLIMQAGGGEDWPNTKRLHSFSDAMFFPDALKGWLIDGANADAAVWQSLDGSVCIALRGNTVHITAPNVVVDSPAVTYTSESISMTASAITLIGDVAISGALTNNGVNVGSGHTHDGVEPGSGSTGGPQ